MAFEFASDATEFESISPDEVERPPDESWEPQAVSYVSYDGAPPDAVEVPVETDVVAPAEESAESPIMVIDELGVPPIGLRRVRVERPVVADSPAAPSPVVLRPSRPIVGAQPVPSGPAPSRLRAIWKPIPAYPAHLRDAGIEGVAYVRVIVAADGSVGEVSITQSSGHVELDRAALETIRQWRFDPPLERRLVEALPVRFILR